MPRQLDQRTADILRRYGEDPDDTKGVVWDCHGTWVVYHRAIERIAARAGVSFDPPQILRAERDEAVILVTASLGDRREWDIGECLLNVNYKVSGKQQAFVWAMAAKRARDRLILKLIGLHGLLYSEEEADQFKGGKGQEPPPPEQNGSISVNGKVVDFPGQSSIEESIEAFVRQSIDLAPSINAVTDFMMHPETQYKLNNIPPAMRDKLRDYAKVRLRALGWPAKKGG